MIIISMIFFLWDSEYFLCSHTSAFIKSLTFTLKTYISFWPFHLILIVDFFVYMLFMLLFLSVCVSLNVYPIMGICNIRRESVCKYVDYVCSIIMLCIRYASCIYNCKSVQQLQIWLPGIYTYNIKQSYNILKINFFWKSLLSYIL